jgi:penicillin-binding protein 1A
MKSAHGSFCGDFAQPKVPFSPQPFFGKYSRIQPVKPVDPNADKKKKGDKSKNGGGANGNGGAGGTKYPPDAYAAPTPTAPSPPAQTSPPPAQNGAVVTPPTTP